MEHSCVPVFALRHGQSRANVAGIISSDPAIATCEHGLSDVGREQVTSAAEQLVARAKELSCGVAICSSDFLRARHTADICHAAMVEADVAVWPTEGVSLRQELRERWFGIFDGGKDDMYENVWREDALDESHEKFGVESVRSVLIRARRLLATVRAQLGPSHSQRWLLLLVAHGDVLQILQTHFDGVDPRLHRKVAPLPTATLRAIGTLSIETGEATFVGMS